MLIKKGNKNMRTQGDVNFEFAGNFMPKGAKKISCKEDYIIAHGESGHKHVIQNNPFVELYEYYDNELEEKCLLLKILKKQAKANPKHEEHESFINDLPVGNHIIRRTHEFDPFEKISRQVQD